MENRSFNPILIGILLLAVFLFICSDCGKRNPLDILNPDDDLPSKEESSTASIDPVDTLFLDFKNQWRNYINPRAELQFPVRSIFDDIDTGGGQYDDDDVQQEEPWAPLVHAECKLSEDAGAFVPFVSMSWIEAEYRETKSAPERFDLSIHPDGFNRGYYTTIYPLDAAQRFNLLQNSEMAKDEQAVLMTGPNLFPRFVSLTEEVITNQNIIDPKEGQLKRYTLLMKELGPGLSYTIRQCQFEGQSWTAVKQYVFTTPVCTQKF